MQVAASKNVQQLQLSAEVPLDRPRHRALLILLLLLLVRRRRWPHRVIAGAEGGTASGHELSCTREGILLWDPSQDRWVRVELA